MARDWQQEFKYLETRHTIPSTDDLYNSLRNVIAKESSAALAELAVVVFRRIAQLEQDLALARRESLQGISVSR